MGLKIRFSTSMTRGEKVCTGILCGLATALFIVPSASVSWADVSLTTAGAAAVVPAGWAALWWSLKSTIDVIDERRAADEPMARVGELKVQAAQAEHDQQAETVPVTYVRPSRRGEVIEGEVLSR